MNKFEPDNFRISKPEVETIGTLIFAHGAGAPMSSDWMEGVSEKLTSAGIKVIRFNFPYMTKAVREGRRTPPNRLPALIEHFEEVITTCDEEGLIEKKLFIGGKSMGGRVATHITSPLINGHICFGFPFYSPGKPSKKRFETLIKVTLNLLILQGERDPFGGRHYIEKNIDPISNISCLILKDGDHDLRPRKKSGITLDKNLNEATSYAASFIKRGGKKL